MSRYDEAEDEKQQIVEIVAGGDFITTGKRITPILFVLPIISITCDKRMVECIVMAQKEKKRKK